MCYKACMEKSLKIIAGAAGFLALVAACFVLKILSSIFIPMVLALFFSIFFLPLLNLMERKRIPRLLGVIFAVLVLLLLLLFASLFLLNTVSKFAVEFPKYQVKIQSFYIQLDGYLQNFGETIGSRLNYDMPENFSLFSLIQTVKWGDWISSGLNAVVNRSFSFISAFTVLVLFLVFILSERVVIQDRLKLIFIRRNEDGSETSESLKKAEKVAAIVSQIGKDTLSYLWLKTIISALTAFCVGIATSVVGMDFVPLWVAITFFFNFIPNIGSIAAVFIIATFGFAQFSPNWPVVAYIFFINGIIQFIIGNWLDPMLQGKKFNLSPVIVFFSLLFWSWMWGIVGMFLAVPMMMLIKIIMINIPALQPVEALISGDSSGEKDEKIADRVKAAGKRVVAFAVRVKAKWGKKNGK